MEIEQGVPIPPVKNLGITQTLRSLKTGESVFIEGRKAAEMSGFVRNARLAGKVTMRSMDGGVRIWKIKD